MVVHMHAYMFQDARSMLPTDRIHHSNFCVSDLVMLNWERKADTLRHSNIILLTFPVIPGVCNGSPEVSKTWLKLVVQLKYPIGNKYIIVRHHGSSHNPRSSTWPYTFHNLLWN